LSARINLATLNGYLNRKFKGDRTSDWQVSGWKTIRGTGYGMHRLAGQLITQSNFSSNPTITRNEYVNGPTKINITYRTSGGGAFTFMITEQRKSLNDKSPL